MPLYPLYLSTILAWGDWACPPHAKVENGGNSGNLFSLFLIFHLRNFVESEKERKKKHIK